MKTPIKATGKRETLKEYLLGEIRSRHLKPGDRLYSRTEFMRRFRCARATVDHVIDELIANKILTGQNGSGTFVATPARRNVGTTLAIALPMPENFSLENQPTRGFLAHQMAQSFTQQLQSDYSVKFFGFAEIKQPDAWEKCKAGRGIVFIQADIEQAPLLADARALHIPHIALYRDPPDSSFVSIDNYGGMANVVDALVKRGCKRIAFVARRVGRYHFQEQRYAGYLEGLLRNGLPLDKSLVGHVCENREAEFLQGLFAAGKKPDAVVGMAWCRPPPMLKALQFSRSICRAASMLPPARSRDAS